jgi:hypothetical protein
MRPLGCFPCQWTVTSLRLCGDRLKIMNPSHWAVMLVATRCLGHCQSRLPVKGARVPSLKLLSQKGSVPVRVNGESEMRIICNLKLMSVRPSCARRGPSQLEARTSRCVVNVKCAPRHHDRDEQRRAWHWCPGDEPRPSSSRTARINPTHAFARRLARSSEP